MIRLYKEDKKQLSIVENQSGIFDKIEPNMWIEVLNPTMEDIRLLHEKTQLPLSFLSSALDEEESAHVDTEDDNTLIVLDAPVLSVSESGKVYYVTTPFVVTYNANYFVTVCSKDVNLVQTMFSKKWKVEPHKHVRLSLQILFQLASLFISSLKKIDNRTREVERILHSSMKNKELFDLMELNKSLVYFSTALNANKIVLSKLRRIEEYNKYDQDFELMEDVSIEYNQATEMCSIYRDILSGMMDAFASIISNNLNIVMKVLAIITIVLSIPTLIASFYGMNVDSIPLANTPFGF